MLHTGSSHPPFLARLFLPRLRRLQEPGQPLVSSLLTNRRGSNKKILKKVLEGANLFIYLFIYVCVIGADSERVQLEVRDGGEDVADRAQHDGVLAGAGPDHRAGGLRAQGLPRRLGLHHPPRHPHPPLQ